TVAAAGVTFNDPVTIQAPAGAGSITVDGTITGADDASVTLDGPGATTTLNADILTEGNEIVISDTVTLGTPGTVTVDSTYNGAAGADITIVGAVNDDTADTTAFVLDAGDGEVILQDAVGGTAAPSSLTATGDVISVDAITAGDVYLTADDMVLSGAITAAGGDVELVNRTAGWEIDLGTNTAGKLGLTAAELAGITADSLRIGSAGAGAIVVSDAIDLTGGPVQTLRLTSGGAVTEAGANDGIAVQSLLVVSQGATMGGVNDVTNLAAVITGAGNGLTFHDEEGGFAITTVDGEAGITTAGGDVTLTAKRTASADADVTSDEAITTTGPDGTTTASGAVSIEVSGSGGSGKIDLGGAIDTTGVSNVAINGGAGGAVTLETDMGYVSVGAIDTSGGDSTNASGGDAGAIAISADGDWADGHGDVILTEDVTSLGGNWGIAGVGAAGAIELNPSASLEIQQYSYNNAAGVTLAYFYRPTGLLRLEKTGGGTLTIQGGAVKFGPDGYTHVPGVATIVAPQDVEIASSSFEMAQYTKFLVGDVDGVGDWVARDLTIGCSTGQGIIGDISATGNIEVDAAGGIRFLLRPATKVKVMTVTGLEYAVLVYDGGAPRNDKGLDYVAGGWIVLNNNGNQSIATPETAGHGYNNPVYAVGDIVNSSGMNKSDPRHFGILTVGARQDISVAVQDEEPVGGVPLDPDNIYLTDVANPPAEMSLDMVAQPVSVGPPPDVIIPILPTPWTREVGGDPAVDEALREQLVRIGIYARSSSPEERLEWMLSIVLYNDLGSMAKEATASDYTVSVGRLSGTIAARAVRQYYDLFFKGPEEDRQYQGEEISRVLQAALDNFAGVSSSEVFEPERFRKYLAETDSEKQAYAYVTDLEDLFHSISLLGLTDIEFDVAADVLLQDFVAQGPSALKFRGKALSRAQIQRIIGAWRGMAAVAAR
ncbi:MAG: hypothetical protein HQ546_05420, partial [Planctomycetes bacterium]|nr:hypothetical protein [Planctomycetota bacterium]